MAVDVEEGTKPLPTIFYFKCDNACLRVCDDPGKPLRAPMAT